MSLVWGSGTQFLIRSDNSQIGLDESRFALDESLKSAEMRTNHALLSPQIDIPQCCRAATSAVSRRCLCERGTLPRVRRWRIVFSSTVSFMIGRQAPHSRAAADRAASLAAGQKILAFGVRHSNRRFFAIASPRDLVETVSSVLSFSASADQNLRLTR